MKRHKEIMAHLNARIRAMKTSLISAERFEDLLEQGEISVLIDVLLNSPYEEDMNEALAHGEGADAVEEAASRHLVRTLRQLQQWSPGAIRPLVDLFLARWDLACIKSIIRAQHAAVAPEEFACAIVPGVTLTPARVAAFRRADSLPALIALVASSKPAWWAAAPGEALAEAQRLHSPAPVEEALDRAYFVDGVSGLGADPGIDAQMLRRVFEMEIDRINVRTVLLGGAHGLDAEAIRARLLPGGALSPRIARRMAAAGDPVAAMECLGATPYKGLVAGLFAFLQSGRFTPIERLFEAFMLHELRRLSRWYVLTLAVLMHYAWLKQHEVANLRLLARGLAGRLPPGRLREEMHYA